MKALFLEYRGGGDDVLREALEAAQGITEPQVPGTIEWALAYKAFRTGELEDAYVRGLRAAEYWHKWVPSTCILSLRAALATGERDKALKAISIVEANRESGADAEGARLIASAGRSLLDGRSSDAVAYYRRAADLARDAGFHLMQAEAIMDAIVLAPEVSESRAWADEAREIFDRIGARPYLIELERALAADERAAHARAADPLSEPAPQRG